MEAANVSEKWFVILSKKYIFNKLNFTYIPKTNISIDLNIIYSVEYIL